MVVLRQLSLIASQHLRSLHTIACQELQSICTLGGNNTQINLFSMINIFVFFFLQFSYLKGALEGDTIVVDAKAVRKGKTLAYLECELRNKANGHIIAKGSQTKYIATS